MNEEKSLTFKLRKECKHSRCYEAEDKDSPIETIYVKRPFSNSLLKVKLVLTKGE